MSTPMNEELYRRLERTCGPVRVSSLGIPIRFTYERDWVYRSGRLSTRVIEYGETYYVNCPLCSDTRRRLAVNHHWAVREDRTDDDMLHLVHCFNDNCFSTRAAQKELHERVFPFGGHVSEIHLQSPVASPPAAPAPEFALPETVPLSQLADNHSALRYLRKRRFDPQELEQVWEVGYCDDNSEARPKFFDRRIVIPIYTWRELGQPRVRLAGWQARRVEPDPDPDLPKYLSAAGMKRNDLLYGLVQARKTEGPVVIVEGPTDVWRIGPGALALLGKTISQTQERRLRRHFASRPVVVLLDRGAEADAKKVAAAILANRDQDASVPVVIARLPSGRDDPGDCTRKEAWQAINAALAAEPTPTTE